MKSVKDDTFITDPEITRLDLKDGKRWIEVKNRLNLSETLRLSNAGLSGIKGRLEGDKFGLGDEPEMAIDVEKMQVERFFIWLTDWNFKNNKDKVVKLDRTSIKNLNPDVADEISELLDNHINEMEELKKRDTSTT